MDIRTCSSTGVACPTSGEGECSLLARETAGAVLRLSDRSREAVTWFNTYISVIITPGFKTIMEFPQLRQRTCIPLDPLNIASSIR